VNLREQLLLYRINKMRTNLALAQRRQAAQHVEAADPCQCPACAIKRALTDAIAKGTGAVRISAVDLMQPRDGPDETPKH
jgi:hypothetical protein